MDGGVQDFLSLAPGTKFNVVPVTNGNVLILPIQAPPPPLISDTSSVPLSAASIASQVQIMQAQPLHFHTAPLHQHTAPLHQHSTAPRQRTAPLRPQQPSLPVHTDAYQRLPSQTPVTLSVEVSGDVISSLDPLALSSADDSLADLQPEDSGGEEEEEATQLTPEQQKLEFMAALGLVPPAVLEEIHRRQQLCRAEYGNWWDRLHSTDFCLVPKTDSALFQPMTDLSEPPFSHVDVQQVATGPDTGSSVEQITYLTSWPPTSTTEPANTIEVVTQQTPTAVEEPTLSEQQHRNEIAVAAQALREHYMSLVGERQVDDPALQATLQQLASAFTFPPNS